MTQKNHNYTHTLSRFIFFGSIIFLLFLFVKKISTVLLPFIIAFIIAYVTSPYSTRFQHKFKIGKNAASALIVVFIQIVFILILTIILPLIYNQIISMIEILPTIIKLFEAKILPIIPKFLQEIYIEIIKYISLKKEFVITEIMKSEDFFTKAYSSGIFIINVFSTIFLAPVLSFYMLRDWGKIHKTFLNILPINFKSEFEILVHEIRKKVSGYITGEALAIAILSLMYGIGLFFTGLKFGFFIGVLTAIFSIIPYIGFAVCFTSALIIAFATNMTYIEISIIITVFLTVQIIESNYIIPKLVGGKVGLHPLWIIFGLMAGGSLFGFFGLFIAIPTTTIIGVLIKHYVKKYKNSEYYEN